MERILFDFSQENVSFNKTIIDEINFKGEIDYINFSSSVMGKVTIFADDKRAFTYFLKQRLETFIKSNLKIPVKQKIKIEIVNNDTITANMYLSIIGKSKK